MMRAMIPLFAWLAQAPVPAPVQSATPPAAEEQASVEPAVVEPWAGTIAEGFAEIRKFADANLLESARTTADRLLAPNAFLRWKREFAARGGWRADFVAASQPTIDWLALDGLDAGARAEVWFARGVVDTLAKTRREAETDFEAARAGAVDRALRHDAIYDLGGLALGEGEEIRATLPEISGKPPPPPLPIPPGMPGGPAAQQPPDPLQLARAAYLKARGHYVERLRSDWRDDDTQKNVELCLRRLRELDDIEKKREEQKKKQEEQQKKDQQDQKDKQDQKDQKDQKDPNQKSDKNDSKDDPKPQDPKPEDEQKPKPPEDKKPDEKPDPKKPDEKKDAKPEEPKEQQMSREEMMQLLDRLKQLEDENKKIQAQLKAARRGKVKKDW